MLILMKKIAEIMMGDEYGNVRNMEMKRSVREGRPRVDPNNNKLKP